MAYPVINEKNVYFCTGKPLPADIKYIADSLLNDTYQESFNKVIMLNEESFLPVTHTHTHTHTNKHTHRVHDSIRNLLTAD